MFFATMLLQSFEKSFKKCRLTVKCHTFPANPHHLCNRLAYLPLWQGKEGLFFVKIYGLGGLQAAQLTFCD